jgi:hypothetical protein
MVMVVMMSAALRLASALRVLDRLRICLLRSAQVAGLQIRAEGLKILIQLRGRLRAAAAARGGAGCRVILRILRDGDKVLLCCLQVSALEVIAQLLEVGEELLCTVEHVHVLAEAARNC